ncbi:MAG TPA: hypothetical protein VGG74_23830 [Kofleriaceae bacterium]
MLAVALGLVVSAGIYLAYLWPRVEPADPEAPVDQEAKEPADP